ncbi:hypothetical protein HZ326_0906 [Fusarium oxysporum f. sp. albedinis]|nr:hypothetical protein HZ326_0906 [Fusarium oxysporum f. sp. albedinis]
MKQINRRDHEKGSEWLMRLVYRKRGWRYSICAGLTINKAATGAEALGTLPRLSDSCRFRPGGSRLFMASTDMCVSPCEQLSAEG